jgi:hypothetical protein
VLSSLVSMPRSGSLKRHLNVPWMIYYINYPEEALKYLMLTHSYLQSLQVLLEEESYPSYLEDEDLRGVAYH